MNCPVTWNSQKTAIHKTKKTKQLVFSCFHDLSITDESLILMLSNQNICSRIKTLSQTKIALYRFTWKSVWTLTMHLKQESIPIGCVSRSIPDPCIWGRSVPTQGSEYPLQERGWVPTVGPLPCEQNDWLTQMWKHYLPVTLLAGGNEQNSLGPGGPKTICRCMLYEIRESWK